LDYVGLSIYRGWKKMEFPKECRGRSRNGWQDEVREDGRIVGGEGW
jgi:hypothetical protein